MTATYDELEERYGFSRPLPEPGPGECLCCFLFRTLDEHGCDGALLWAGVWRDLVAPDRIGLEDTLRARGGFCDCEVLMNMHWPLQEPGDGEPLPPCLADPAAESRIACALFS